MNQLHPGDEEYGKYSLLVGASAVLNGLIQVNMPLAGLGLFGANAPDNALENWLIELIICSGILEKRFPNKPLVLNLRFRKSADGSIGFTEERFDQARRNVVALHQSTLLPSPLKELIK